MKVLVTGSSGRIGARVVHGLLKRGYSVRGLDLVASGRAAGGYEEIAGSMDDVAVAAAACEGIGAVLHLGASMSWDPKDTNRMSLANCQGTYLLAESAVAAGVERFVFASSGEVCPENNPVELPIAETHPCRPVSQCGLTKLLGEDIVQFYRRSGKLETVILRFGHTQDARELLDEGSFFSGPRFFFGQRRKQQERFGNREPVRLLRKLAPGRPALILSRNENGCPFRMHITDSRDTADGVLLALERREAAGGTCNLGSTEPVEFGWLLDRMSEITGLPVVPVDFPGPGVNYRTSNEKIRRELGFDPKWTIGQMLGEAADARNSRCGNRN